jgi:hypothetical protein
MNTIVVVTAPDYLSFYVAGSRRAKTPLQANVHGILANEECIRVPCLYWNDGDTTITLGSAKDVDPGRTPDFDGLLDTPEGEVMVSDTDDPRLAAYPTVEGLTRIRIWINHPTEPDEVVIGVG